MFQFSDQLFLFITVLELYFWTQVECLTCNSPAPYDTCYETHFNDISVGDTTRRDFAWNAPTCYEPHIVWTTFNAYADEDSVEIVELDYYIDDTFVSNVIYSDVLIVYENGWKQCTIDTCWWDSPTFFNESLSDSIGITQIEDSIEIELVTADGFESTHNLENMVWYLYCYDTEPPSGTPAPTLATVSPTTAAPTDRPTTNPTARPTFAPTDRPTIQPTYRPTANPATITTTAPPTTETASPTAATGSPTGATPSPTASPTTNPTPTTTITSTMTDSGVTTTAQTEAAVTITKETTKITIATTESLDSGLTETGDSDRDSDSTSGVDIGVISTEESLQQDDLDGDDSALASFFNLNSILFISVCICIGILLCIIVLLLVFILKRSNNKEKERKKKQLAADVMNQIQNHHNNNKPRTDTHELYGNDGDGDDDGVIGDTDKMNDLLSHRVVLKPANSTTSLHSFNSSDNDVVLDTSNIDRVLSRVSSVKSIESSHYLSRQHSNRHVPALVNNYSQDINNHDDEKREIEDHNQNENYIHNNNNKFNQDDNYNSYNQNYNNHNNNYNNDDVQNDDIRRESTTNTARGLPPLPQTPLDSAKVNGAAVAKGYHNSFEAAAKAVQANGAIAQYEASGASGGKRRSGKYSNSRFGLSNIKMRMPARSMAIGFGNRNNNNNNNHNNITINVGSGNGNGNINPHIGGLPKITPESVDDVDDEDCGQAYGDGNDNLGGGTEALPIGGGLFTAAGPNNYKAGEKSPDAAGTGQNTPVGSRARGLLAKAVMANQFEGENNRINVQSSNDNSNSLLESSDSDSGNEAMYEPVGADQDHMDMPTPASATTTPAMSVHTPDLNDNNSNSKFIRTPSGNTNSNGNGNINNNINSNSNSNSNIPGGGLMRINSYSSVNGRKFSPLHTNSNSRVGNVPNLLFINTQNKGKNNNNNSNKNKNNKNKNKNKNNRKNGKSKNSKSKSPSKNDGSGNEKTKTPSTPLSPRALRLRKLGYRQDLTSFSQIGTKIVYSSRGDNISGNYIDSVNDNESGCDDDVFDESNDNDNDDNGQ